MRRILKRAADILAVLALVYIAAVVLLRPWYLRWGATAAEVRAALPGDETMPRPLYSSTRAVTVHAPADAVWPWLAQIGQDRGGFYSYSWLERAFGDHVTNADRVHPEWQEVHAGGFVRATQPGYLGGIFGDSIGWRIHAVVPGRALVLERWGTFTLRPVDARTTRLVVRTRAGDRPIPVQWAPVELLMFEPAHFIMEQKMMRGIRDRAERG
ncbi:MAG TPA: hypothetical protein VF771_15805 [Longimicrobiaceae bacterium]